MKQPLHHLRNVAISTLALILVVVLVNFATLSKAAPAPPPPSPVGIMIPLQQTASLTVSGSSAKEGIPGGQAVDYDIVIRNTGSAPGTFTVTISRPCSTDIAGCDDFLSQTTFTLNANGQQQFRLSVTLPSTATPGQTARTLLLARLGTTDQGQTSVTTTVVAPTPTRTTTPTTTPTTSPTPSVTQTRTPGPVCRDGFEGDNDRGAAKVIDVNTVQRRAICPAGDVDWLVFGGVGGKVYTIDVPEMAPGIDLSLELFDDQGRSIAFNDDYFDRTAPPNPSDIRPRIQSVTIPYDGRYYIKVRDTAQRGGVNYFYNIALLAEAYGPTPTLVIEICLDLFEPDGLPEQARPIIINELQEDRRLCPTGDADWVTFFAKAGKRYVIYTDTRRYRGPNQVNRDFQAGADTLMLLTDRDGVSPLEFNDDIAGGSTFDSQIEFTPSADGFYYVQIKNQGDVGNQFIRYDLVLQQCLFDQTDCGRKGGDVPRSTPINPSTPLPTATAITEFILPPTRTPIPTATATRAAAGEGAGYQAAEASNGSSFADVAFQLLWQRVDRIGGVERDVLVQAFQRRVLTYTPDNPPGWQVEMDNVGRHYYFWRYGEALP